MTSSQRPTRRAGAALLSASLVAAAVTAGCGSSTEITGTGTQQSGVRIVQAVSDAPNGIDLAVNGALSTSSLSLGTIFPATQGGYAPVFLGTTFAFAPTGGAAFYNEVPALAANAGFTIIAYGRVASNAPAATAAVLADTGALQTGPVLLRVFNAVDYVQPAGSTGGTPVDVYLYAQGSARPSTPTASVAYGARSAYLTGTVGTLQVDVFAAGTAGTGTPLFTSTVSTNAASIRTLVLLDPPATASAGTAGSVLVLNDYK